MFRLWAPAAARVSALELDARRGDARWRRSPDGWHELAVPQAAPARATASCCPTAWPCPIRRRAANPDGVHGASQVVDPAAFDWHDGAWRGRPWHEAVIYELHVGTFTAAGTFAAAIERLPSTRGDSASPPSS